MSGPSASPPAIADVLDAQSLATVEDVIYRRTRAALYEAGAGEAM